MGTSSFASLRTSVFLKLCVVSHKLCVVSVAGLLIHFKWSWHSVFIGSYSPVLEAKGSILASSLSWTVPFTIPCALADSEVFWKIPPFTSTSLRLIPSLKSTELLPRTLCSHMNPKQADYSTWLFLGCRGGFSLHTSFVQALSDNTVSIFLCYYSLSSVCRRPPPLTESFVSSWAQWCTSVILESSWAGHQA